MDKKIIYDLNAIGYSIIYLPEYKWYLAHISSMFYNPSNHIHDISIEAKDITELFEHAASSFTDQQTTHTKINNTPTRKYSFDKDTKFIWFKA